MKLKLTGSLLSDDGLVGSNSDFCRSRDGTADNNDSGVLQGGSSRELGESRDSSDCAASATGSTAVGAGVSNVGRIGDGGSLLESARVQLFGRSRGGGGQASQHSDSSSELHVER